MYQSLDYLETLAAQMPKSRIAVAGAQEADALRALEAAYKKGYIEPILIGDQEEIHKIADQNNIFIENWKIIHEKDLNETTEKAAYLVGCGEADCIMKGLADTSRVLKSCLKKEYGLRTEHPLSHVAVYEIPEYEKLLFLSDSAMMVYPTLEDKVSIILNSWQVAKAMGYQTFKIACVSISEKQNQKVVSTLDGFALTQMCAEGKFSKELVVEGPMGFDLAICKESALTKNYYGNIQGDADMVLCPNLEMGNAVGKAFSLIGNSTYAGVVMGAKKPIILTSRADSPRSKLMSILLGSIVAGGGSYGD